MALWLAYIGPLIAGMVALGTLFAYLSKRRERLIQEIVNEAVVQLDKRLTLVETQLSTAAKHLDNQDTALASALQSIARIEGRLMGGEIPR